MGNKKEVTETELNALRPCIEAMVKSFPNISKALDDGKKYVKENSKEIYIEYLKLIEEEGNEKGISFGNAMKDLALKEKTNFVEYGSAVTVLVKLYKDKLDILKKVTKVDKNLYGSLLFIIDECLTEPIETGTQPTETITGPQPTECKTD